ncbi:protein ref(2)P [Drosophila biarmipes]|uniref:protein ref(2)P n=1 Tax=Drosophila biarmipes TaxID=125945 RepID=UPI0007E6A7A6|nr:protein ref(2)P [Drosophila biarmipes]
MNRHEGVVCKGCAKESFTGRCYRCLTCRQFDICADCYNNDFAAGEHPFDHPVVCIYTPADVELYFGGEYISSDPPQSYRCPYCKRWGLNESTFLEHVSSMHPNANPLLVSTMVTLFEQQQAARLFLEDEQLASIVAAATSRNDQMRRTVGSLDLYLVPLNRDGSYMKPTAKPILAPANKALEMSARERILRVTRRNGASAGRSGTSTARPPPAPASGHSSTPEITTDLEDDMIAIATNPRLNWIQRNVAAVFALSEAGSSSNYDLPTAMAPPTAQQQQQQQVAAPGPSAAAVAAASAFMAAPVAAHPSLNEIMRYYRDNPEPGSGRTGRSRPANPALQPASSGSNTRIISVYGPTSALTPGPNNSRSLFLPPEFYPRDERRRSARVPTFPGNSGGIQRVGSNVRALAARNVDFTDLPPEESEMADFESLLRCLKEEPAKLVKQREQERKRYLCYRFLTPRSLKRLNDNFLVLRAEFVAQLLCSALLEEDFQGVSVAPIRIINPKRKFLSGSEIAGAGDAKKNARRPAP